MIMKKLNRFEKCEDCSKKAEYEIIEDMGLYPLVFYLCENCLRNFEKHVMAEVIDYEEYDEYSYLNPHET
jgi:hypothetical protein